MNNRLWKANSRMFSRWAPAICVLLVATEHSLAQETLETAPLRTFRECQDCPEMVVLPAGSFLMGANEDESIREGIPKFARQMTQPQHRVSVKSFAIGKYAVTKDEFAVFVRESGWNPASCEVYEGNQRGFVYKAAASWQAPGFDQTGRDPVVCVSWSDARHYVAWLNSKLSDQALAWMSDPHPYRLPTEAEWEYAARAGTTTSRFWGNDISLQCKYANGGDLTGKDHYPAWTDVANCRDNFVTTAPVGSLRPNSWGLFDMLGNVVQWTEDCWHFDYSGAPIDGSAWLAEECLRREARGGGWTSIPEGVTSSGRYAPPFDRRQSSFGFRVARDVP